MRGYLWRALKGEVMLVQVLIGFIVEGVLAVQEVLGEWSGGLTTRSLCVLFFEDVLRCYHCRMYAFS